MDESALRDTALPWSPMPRQSEWKLFARLVGEGRPYWLYLAGVVLLNLLATPLEL
jgi:hypothetical protein